MPLRIVDVPSACAGLNVYHFTSLGDVRSRIEARGLDYNQRCPHGSLGPLTPNQCVRPRQAPRTVANAALSSQGLSREGAKVNTPARAVDSECGQSARGHDVPNLTSPQVGA